jgi:hypothetical protein
MVVVATIGTGTPDRLRFWEDMPVGAESVVGPRTIGDDQLDLFLELVGAASKAGPARRVPDLFVYSIAAGSVGQTDGYVALVCVRSANYEIEGSLHVGERFFIRTRVVAAEPVDERLGNLEVVRQINTGDNRIVSTARLNALVLRRGS